MYKVHSSNPDAGDKSSAELWAFAAAALPRINECDPTVAYDIRWNTDITLAGSPMSEGYESLKEKLETVYSCLGITCADVGGILDNAATGTYVSGLGPCTDNDNGEELIPMWGLAIIIVVGVLVVAFGAYCCFRMRKRKRTPNLEDSDGLGGFGTKSASTL